ncbi:MAG: hypothetical protein ABSA97_14190 [Verrucomicrobiia bacterium]
MKLTELPPVEAETYKDIRVLRIDRENVFLVKLWRGNAQSPTHFYRFPTAEARDQWIIEQKRQTDQRVAGKLKRDTERAAERDAFRAADHVKVGDIFEHSWGYDQTNIEYFEVVAVGNKTVKVRQIAAKAVEGTQGFMSQTVRPCPGQFLEKTYNLTGGRVRGHEVEGALTVLVKLSSKNEPHLVCQFGWCGRVSADSSTYESWYA